jgi:hypothetical protein
MEWNFLVELLYGFFFFFVSLLSFWVLANGCDLVFEDFHV